ncbi:hypothetical protein RUND412_007256 [Rhizina undulata]
MAPSISIFSRRKASDEKNLGTTLLTNVDATSASGASGLSAIREETTATSYSPKYGSASSRFFHKGSTPVVLSGYSAGSAGIVYAPHLTRSKAAAGATASAATYSNSGNLEARPVLSRSNSDISSCNSGSRRAGSVDQRTPLVNHLDYSTYSTKSSPTTVPNSPPTIPLPKIPSPLLEDNFPLAPAPISATGARHGFMTSGFYSPPVLPISPPLSPESPRGMGVFSGQFMDGNVKSENELLAEIAALKQAVSRRDQVIAKLDASINVNDALESAPKNEAQRVNQILCRRIRDLENQNREKESEIAQHSAQIKYLQENHTAVLETTKQSHSEEILSLRRAAKALEQSSGCRLEDLQATEQLKERELELLTEVVQKDNEIGFLQVHADGLREQVAVMETVVAGKDEELDNAKKQIQELSENSGRRSALDEIADLGLADMGRRLMEEIRRREKAEKKLEEAMIKARNGLEAVLIEEGKKREELKSTIRKEYEQTLVQADQKRTEIQQKAKEDLDYVLVEEEKRRAEINWIFNSKVETLESQLRVDSEESRKQIETLGKTKLELEEKMAEMSDALEKERNVALTQKSGNDELIQMVKRINRRLGEEKKKNKKLESTIGQITKEAMNNVSGAHTEATQVRDQLEERDAIIISLETELDALRVSKDLAEDMLKKLQSGASNQLQSIEDRDERIKDLESESGELRDRIDSLLQELRGLKNNSEPEEQYSAKLTENSSTPESSPEEIETMEKKIHQMEVDIDLYRKDIKCYKRDIKKRDSQISKLSKHLRELEEKLQQKTKEAKAYKSTLGASVPENITVSNESNDPSEPGDENVQLRQKIQAVEEEREALQKKHDDFTSQQSLVISEMEAQLTKIKKEKETIEHAAAKQLRTMQVSFQQLSQAAVAGGLASLPPAVAKYQSNPLPPLPTCASDLDMRTKSKSRRKKSLDSTSGKPRPASLMGSSEEIKPPRKVGEKDVNGVEEEKEKEKEKPVSAASSAPGSPVTETAYKRLSERERLQRTLSVVHEPDGALGDEEIIEW